MFTTSHRKLLVSTGVSRSFVGFCCFLLFEKMSKCSSNKHDKIVPVEKDSAPAEKKKCMRFLFATKLKIQVNPSGLERHLIDARSRLCFLLLQQKASPAVT